MFSQNIVLFAEKYKIQFGIKTNDKNELIDYPIYFRVQIKKNWGSLI
jgi:hypothetical protein